MEHPEPTLPSTYTFSNYDDDFKLDPSVVQLLIDSKKVNKVAFMSGARREYYPEKVGHSKFAMVNAPFGDPQLPPYNMYSPPETDRLNKPISTKGYGIGGLSAPRFAPNVLDKHPGPGQYETKPGKHQFPPRVWMDIGLVKKQGEGLLKQFRIEATHRKLRGMWDDCQQGRIGFGTNLKQPRFGKPPTFNTVGPAHYLAKENNPRISVNNGFLRGPVVFNTSTKIHCTFAKKGCCVECGEMLESSMDYYRSKNRITLKDFDYHRRQLHRRSEDIVPDGSHHTSSTKVRHAKKKRVLICRTCYCKAMRGESKFWKRKKEVKAIFEKTRHCSFIHEHNGLPQYTEKASCSLLRNLKKKEAALSSHYPDKCDKRLIPRYKKEVYV